MKNKDINEMIRTAVSHSVPDILDSILSDCDKEKGKVIQMNESKTKRSNWMRTMGLVAAAFILTLVGIGARGIYTTKAVDSIVSFDINPSLIMKVNKKEKVLEVLPLNDDGKLVIGEMDFKNTDLEVAINALIGSMLKQGYIDNIQNSILISVENKDEKRGARLQAKLVKEIDSLLNANSVQGAILSQALSADSTIKALADENHISLGKAQIIEQLVEYDIKYEFKDLAKLSINELNNLIDSKKLELSKVSTVGKVSDKAYIGTSKAKAIALNHAGVNSSHIEDFEVELDYDDGRMIYEVEFEVNGREYEYDIDAITGEIISYDIEGDYTSDDKDDEEDYDYDDSNNDKDRVKEKDKNKDANKNVSNDKDRSRDRSDDDDDDDDDDKSRRKSTSDKVQETSTMLLASEARKKVINKFGGIIQKIEYNYDDKNPLYKGEALKSGKKVVFELNARTASFKKWDVDNDDDWDEFSHAIADMLTMDEAVNSVIKKSGKSDTFVQKIEFKWDDSEPIYQGEAFNRGVKYSFEIDAYGGTYEEWDMSKGDDTWADKYYNVK